MDELAVQKSDAGWQALLTEGDHVLLLTLESLHWERNGRLVGRLAVRANDWELLNSDLAFGSDRDLMQLLAIAERAIQVSPNGLRPAALPFLGKGAGRLLEVLKDFRTDVEHRVLSGEAGMLPMGGIPRNFAALDDRRRRWLAEAVDEAAMLAEQRTWLATGVLPAESYGFIAAAPKCGKTYTLLDLAVSVASGRSWLNSFPCARGPVLLYLGEGQEVELMRRMVAIAASKGLDARALPIALYYRVPYLLDVSELADLQRDLEEIKPILVGIDPFYFAAVGIDQGSMFSVAQALRPIQMLCQQAHATLLMLHHVTKTGDQKDVGQRMAGAGVWPWARVIFVGEPASDPQVDPVTGMQTIRTRWQVQGSAVEPHAFVLRTTLREDVRHDPASPLHYTVGQEADEHGQPVPVERRGHLRDVVLGILLASRDPMSVTSVREELPDAWPATEERLRGVLVELAAKGLAVQAATGGSRAKSGLWQATLLARRDATTGDEDHLEEDR